MFTVFILCALVPTVVLAIISFTHVTGQLREQGQDRLRQSSKALGMAIYERLGFLEAELKTVASSVDSSPKNLTEELGARFRGLSIFVSGAETRPLFGNIENSLDLNRTQKEHLSSGKTVVFEQVREEERTRIFMARALEPEDPATAVLLGEVNATYLWGDESTLPPWTELCILDESSTVLHCSRPSDTLGQEARKAKVSASGQFEWEDGEEQYLAGYWSMPLFAFSSSAWKVVLSQSRAVILAPMADFRRTFPLVILMSLWVVLLLSFSQIRRSLDPLEKLQDGTRRIANRDFTSQVEIESGDEFEELAHSFNGMARRLGRQFHTLSTMEEIDRAVLSVLDTDKIVDTVLTRMPDIFPCRSVSLSLIDSKNVTSARTYTRSSDPGGETQADDVELSRETIQELRASPKSFLISGGKIPPYLVTSARHGIETWLVFPIFFNGELAGIASLGDVDGSASSQEDLVRARQLVDQVAVALSNARLIERLDELSWGTLIALARTIDAKSPWTLGHSERAAELGVKIGRVLGLSQAELDDLHRGALLHDIGKIGIPPSILDKAGKLTPEETAVMQEHPVIGARILEPIVAYAAVVPVVAQHHEWYDGSGYPYGLSGEEISYSARIYAVADVFDALIADRPYRAGLELQNVISYIKDRAGLQFDPTVVEAFLKVMTPDAQREHLAQRRSVITSQTAAK
jgi:putative nucleotidyltransferase with HDIG domain